MTTMEIYEAIKGNDKALEYANELFTKKRDTPSSRQRRKHTCFTHTAARRHKV